MKEPPQPTETDAPEMFEAHAEWVEQQNSVVMARPIQDAPKDGRWLLGHMPDRVQYRQQWGMIAWGDEGWYDNEGNGAEPDLFALLPDPQPEHTGWAPVAGTIQITELSADGWTDGKGNPVKAPWRWMVSIERPDGSFDKYRDSDMRVTLDEAQRCALKWQDKFGLPIVTAPLDQKVVPFRSAATLQ